MTEERIFVTAKEAASMLSVSMPTFYELAAIPGFPCIRKGKKYLVNAKGLQKWAEKNSGKFFA